MLVFAIALHTAEAQLPEAIKLYEAKKTEEARKALLTVKESSRDYAEAQYYLGRIAHDGKQYDDASDYLENAIDINDKVAAYHYWYGTTMAMIAQDANVLKQGMLATKIKDEYELTVKLDPSYMSAYWGLIEFYTQAPGFMGGSFDKAYETARSIMKLNATDGHRALAYVYVKEEKYVEAEKSYLEAYKLNAELFGMMMNFYANRKMFDKGFAFLEQEMKKYPDQIGLQYQFGRCSAMSGQHLDRGAEYLTKYLAYQPKPNEPGHGGAYMRLAQIREKQNRKEDAKKLFESALRVDASLKEAKEGLARVSK